MKNITSLEDILPDRKNANKGTVRGNAMLERSIRQYGAGRSIVVDRDAETIGGAKTLEAAVALGLPVRVVQTDGTELVVVQRTDLDLDTDTRARELALADNRVGQVNLDVDVQVLVGLGEEIDLSGFWDRDEIEELYEAAALADEIESGLSSAPSAQRKLGDTHKQIKPVLYADEVDVFEQALAATGERNRGHALIQICKAYLDRTV